MNVSIKQISRKNELSTDELTSYELHLLVGETEHVCHMNVSAKPGPLSSDRAFSDCLYFAAPMAMKHVAKIVRDVHEQKAVKFPVDLGNF